MATRAARRWCSDTGASLVSLLVTLVLLGGLAGIVVMAQSGSSGPKTSIQIPQLPRVGAAPANAGPDIAAAAIEACKATYQAVSEAAATYEAVNGHPAPNVAALQAMLKDPVNGVGFQITLDQSGRAEVATPGHPSSAGDANCAYA